MFLSYTMFNKRLSLDDNECDRNIIDRSDFGGRLKTFVSKNFLTLYNKDYKLKGLESPEPDTDIDHTEKSLTEADFYCQTPPFERFLRIDSRSLCQKFFQDLKIGDLVFGRIEHVSSSDLSVRLLCTAGRFERDLEDLKILGSIPTEECISLEMRRDDFTKDTLIRAGVHSFDFTEKTVRLTFQSMPDISLHLGIIYECDLPLFFRNDYCDNDFDKCLKSERTFDNPNSIDLLCRRLGLNIFNHSTLFQSIRSVDYSSEKRAGHLRKVQTHDLAMKSVERGVEKLRNDDSLIAMQHFNKALQIEAENVEALVARGALFANKESFDLAIQDFTAALINQPDHRNAKIYLVETLIAQSKALASCGFFFVSAVVFLELNENLSQIEIWSFQREEKWRKAKKCLDSVLELDADNVEALNLVGSLKNGRGDPANDCEEVINKSRSEKVSLDPSIIEKYGVDRRTFKNPDFRSKFDEYRQKFNKKRSSCSNNDYDIIDLTYEASSSNIIGESNHTAKRKYNEKQENVNLKRGSNSNNNIDHSCNNVMSKINGKDEVKTDRSKNTHKDPRTESNGQWKRDLKKMEDFIHVLKTKKN